MKHFIYTIILFATLLLANALEFSQCSETYPNPVTVSLLPDPPVFGQPAEVSISTMAYITVEFGAYVDIQISSAYWRVPISYQQDVCNDVYVRDCPISNNYTFNYKFNYSLGSQSSNLTLNIEAKLVNPDENILSCINGVVTIQAPY
jgi:hypothetical protein